MESHLQDCASCRALAARQARLRELVRESAAAVTAPDGLRARLFEGLDAVDAEGGPVDASVVPIEAATDLAENSGRRPLWGSLSVAASVAGVTMFLWVAAGGFGGDAHVDDVVAKHAKGLPVEVSEPDPARLRGWMKGKVDFNPRLWVFSAKAAQPLRPQGLRLTHIGDQPAIHVAYSGAGEGRQASLFAFPDASVRLVGRRLDNGPGQKAMGDLHVANRRGYSVVMWKDNEIVYELVSDLDDASVLELVKSAQSY